MTRGLSFVLDDQLCDPCVVSTSAPFFLGINISDFRLFVKMPS